jgi:hypothetical protein
MEDIQLLAPNIPPNSIMPKPRGSSNDASDISLK